MTHPALDTVLWIHDAKNRCERALYRGHILEARNCHSDNGVDTLFSLGFIDGIFIGSRPNMPTLCELLFSLVDRQLAGPAK